MSKFSVLQLGVTAVFATILAANTLAFSAPAPHIISKSVSKMLQKGERVVRPQFERVKTKQFTTRFDPRTSVDVDSLTGAVRLITGDLGPAPKSLATFTKSDIIDVATNWIASHEDILQVQLEDVSLLDDATLISDSDQLISFNVSRNGTPVLDASINFRFKFGRLVQVQSKTFGEALEDHRTGFINATDAIERIASAANILEQGQAYRVEAKANGYKLVRVNKAVVSIDGETLLVQTEAATGQIFESKKIGKD
jgi:hypothetical protein